MAAQDELFSLISKIAALGTLTAHDKAAMAHLTAAGANPCAPMILLCAMYFENRDFWTELARGMTCKHLLAAMAANGDMLRYIPKLIDVAPHLFASEECVQRATRDCAFASFAPSSIHAEQARRVAILLVPFMMHSAFAELPLGSVRELITNNHTRAQLLRRGVFDKHQSWGGRGIVSIACEARCPGLITSIIRRTNTAAGRCAAVLQMGMEDWIAVFGCDTSLICPLIAAGATAPFAGLLSRLLLILPTTQMVASMIRGGAIVDCAAVFTAARLVSPTNILRLLLATHHCPGCNQFGQTPLAVICAQAFPPHDIIEICDLFTRSGANPHQQDGSGASAFSCICAINVSIHSGSWLILPRALEDTRVMMRKWNPLRAFANATHPRIGADSPAQLLVGFAHIARFIVATATAWNPDVELQ